MIIARRLLAGSKPVKSVASQIGYDSAAPFARVRVVGKAPRNIGRQGRKAIPILPKSPSAEFDERPDTPCDGEVPDGFGLPKPSSAPRRWTAEFVAISDLS